MFEQSLIQLGLTYTQSAVYEVLLKNGALPAGKIAKKTEFKRGLVYKILDDLMTAGLVQKEEEKGKVAIFEVKHPLELRDFAEKKQQKARDAKVALEGILPAIISEFNLASQKPGILFFEGENGIKEVINDTLSSRTDIYTYADMEEINKHIKKINAEYAKKRNRLKIGKKVLLVDSEYTQEFLKKYEKSNLDIRFVKNIPHFATVMQIYDNKVSYVTLAQDKMMGVIIQNPSIYFMHKALFENMWENAKNV
jgi:sugar-specific transcriptional regulator TrmB